MSTGYISCFLADAWVQSEGLCSPYLSYFEIAVLMISKRVYRTNYSTSPRFESISPLLESTLWIVDDLCVASGTGCRSISS